ncbi:reverse transcriptase-like protein [Halobacillus fulvus]|nr:reverse transcriptase-like protein [Halobacillus fulvus]
MNVRIEWMYKKNKGPSTTFTSDEMGVGEALLIAEDLEKTGRVKKLDFVDQQGQSWMKKELKKYMKGVETEPHNVQVYFDGGFYHETQKSGLGCVIYYEKDGKHLRLRRNAAIEELKTNNEAEYAALHLAVKELELLGVHHLPVKFSGDSQVVINQLKGEWPCLEEELSRWADRIEDLLHKLGIEPEYDLVTRKQNKEADRLAGQALEGVSITSTHEH